MKKYILFILIVVFGLEPNCYAQVGIGNANPDESSVLDLSNPENRGLLLPSSSSASAMSKTEGMLYYYNNHLFYKRNDGYNALSPWLFKYNGNVSSDLYYNLNGNIGIGDLDLTISPEAPLHIATDNSVSLINNGAFLIGRTSSVNMVFNSNNIQTRRLGSDYPLYINKNGGDVYFGERKSPVNVRVSKKVKEYHQPTKSYYDLVPTGTIVMWYGTQNNVPTGWALCDGGEYDRSNDQGTITTPDLRGKFVVCAGENGTVSTYTAHETGGEDEITLTTDEMPDHTHSGFTSSGGSHSHSVSTNCAHDDAGSSDTHFAVGDPNNSRGCPSISVSSGGTHSHSITISSAGGGQPFDNRPKYYAIYYIMKL